MRKLDDTNMEIIRHLRDGRKAYAAIADELDITENTVRSRANKLVDDKVLSFRGLVNPEYMPSLQIAIMGIKVSTMDLEKKAQELSALRGVINCCIVTGRVTGRYDLILQLELSEDENCSLLNFFKNELTRIGDISSVETFVVYQSHNLEVPYLL